MSGGGTGKWVKWVEAELGVTERVEGKRGGAEPPRGESGSTGAATSPADREPNSVLTSTSCLQQLP